MKLIKPSVIPLQPTGYGLNDIYKSIEFAGRTCYKSEMSNDPKAFVERMINSGHTAMLEHGTMYFDVPLGNPDNDSDYMRKSSIIQIFKKNQYSRVNKYKKEHNVDHYAITTNYRVFEEQIDWGGLRLDKEYVLSFLCEPNGHHDKRYAFKFICDRGVSHELVRHRVFSFAQESTRYCNYSKEKYNCGLTFIIPSHLELPEGIYVYWDGDWMDPEQMKVLSSDADETNEVNTFLYLLNSTEKDYLYLIYHGWRPQQARAILCNALKTEVVMTGYESDWMEFLKLRYDGATGAPHPDMKVVAEFIADYFRK